MNTIDEEYSSARGWNGISNLGHSSMAKNKKMCNYFDNDAFLYESDVAKSEITDIDILAPHLGKKIRSHIREHEQKQSSDIRGKE